MRLLRPPDPVRFLVLPDGVATALVVAGAVWAALLASAAPASAQAAAPTNEDCQVCHAEPSMTRANGSPVVVDPDAFTSSAHGAFGCVDCHSDLATLTEFPHPDDLAPVECGLCHDASALLEMSVHARAAPAAGGPLQCADCHGPPHGIRPSAEPDSATNRRNVVTTCGACHTTEGPAGTRAGPAVAAMFADSIHGQLVQQGDSDSAPTCTNCHRSHDVVAKTDPGSPVHRMNVPATCGTCHTGPHQEFTESIHGARLAEGSEQAPNCASCHTAHAIERTDSDRWQISAVEQCGTCHREALNTYRDTFHGQVTALGFTPVAKCVDCHRPHRVFPKEDPRSAVHAASLVTTCRTCHPAANDNFVMYQPHANKDDPDRLPALYYAARFMNVLLIGTFSFFGLHSVLWFVRERTGLRDDARDVEPDSDAHD